MNISHLSEYTLFKNIIKFKQMDTVDLVYACSNTELMIMHNEFLFLLHE